MPMLSRLTSFLRNILGKRRNEGELDDEVRGYAEMLAEEKTRAGMNPEEARRTARIELGGVEQVKEQVREARAGAWLDSLFQDLRYGARMLVKNPGFTTLAILTLALGIGANSAIFSAVNGILLRHLPFPHPEELVQLSANKVFAGSGVEVGMMFSPSTWQDVRDQSPAIARLAMYAPKQFALTGETAPEIVSGAEVSNDFFQLLGVPPLLGRIVGPADTQPGQERVVVLTYGLWKELRGDAQILGRTITLNEQTYTVIAVMPPEFDYAIGEQRSRKGVWVPLIEYARDKKDAEAGVNVVARLKRGISLAAFDAQLKTVTSRITPQLPEFMRGANLEARNVKPDFGDIQKSLAILMGAVTFVLLIACVNVSALLLGRSFTRQREVAVREALGASKLRIMRQFLTESILLAAAGGCAGIVFAFGGAHALRVIAPPDTVGVDRVQINTDVLWFTLAVTLLTGIVFGMVPALQASAKRSGAALNESLSGSLSKYQSRSRRLRGALVAFEIALAVILVIGATLVARSFEKLATVELGFRTDHILTMSMTPSPSVCHPGKLDNLDRCILAATEVVRRLRGLPGIETAAVLSSLPLKPSLVAMSLEVEGQKDRAGLEAGSMIAERYVSPEYFQAMGLRLLGGRNFNNTDTKPAPRVAIVNQSFAQRFYSGNAIGRRFNNGNGNSDKGASRWIEVVGVVSDSRDFQLEAKPSPEYYLAFAQSDYFEGSANLIVRTQADPLAMAGAVRRQIWSVDKNAPIAEVKTMDAIVSESVAAPRFRTLLLGAFGALGLLLAMVGVYGVISYAVTQRIHEIGVRMALGAQPRDVLRLVLGEGMLLSAVGIAAGAAGALALTKLLENQLYEIKPSDPVTFITVAVAVAATATLACYVPARRAMRVDPMVALRYE